MNSKVTGARGGAGRGGAGCGEGGVGGGPKNMLPTLDQTD